MTDRKDLIKAAKLYYLAEMSQDEIAALMKVSRSKVSRMLTEARQQQIVQFHICEYSSLQQELEEELKKLLRMETVVVVQPAPGEQGKNAVGRAAARLLRTNLKDNLRIGIQWGSTVGAMVDAYEGKSHNTGVELYQITGGMHISDNILDGRELVKRLAQKMCVGYHLLQYPMVVNSPVLARMIMEDDNREYFRMMDHLDMVVVGLGSDIPEESATYLGGYITREEAAQMVENGLAADICGHRLTREGIPARTALSGRVITISLDQLRRVPLRVGLAAGAHKKQSILAAARGGYLNALVVDDIAAIAVLGR